MTRRCLNPFTAVLGVSPDILVHEVGELGEVLGVAMPTWSSISCSISGGATAEDSRRSRGEKLSHNDANLNVESFRLLELFGAKLQQRPASSLAQASQPEAAALLEKEQSDMQYALKNAAT